MKKTPWSGEEAEKVRNVNKESVIEVLEQWEREILKLSGTKADQEYAAVRTVFMKVGERVGRQLAADHQNKCAYCKKPLPPRGPVDTIPKPAPESALGWVNQFACSTKCADALRVDMHDREMKRLAEANG